MFNQKSLQTSGIQFGFVLFLPFHASVLEPDFDLAFSQAKGVGDLDPSPPRQVAIEMEFLFQFQRLKTGVGLSSPLPFGYSNQQKIKESGQTIDNKRDRTTI